jgi:hypothetical protein
MSKKKTATIQLYCKEPDEFGNLIEDLGLSETKADAHFEFGEYATLELTIDSDLRVVGGRVVPLNVRKR